MSFWEGRSVLVTGGAGFIGSHLVDALLPRGARVRVPVLPPEAGEAAPWSLPAAVDVVPADLRRFEDCTAVCQGCDVVLNLAARDGSIEFKKRHGASILRDNALIALHMLEAARRQRVERFLVMSSAEVYGPTAPVPTSEEAAGTSLPSGDSAAYAWSKRFAELAAQSYAQAFGLNVAIARPSNVYGPRDHTGDAGRVIPHLVQRVIRGEAPIVIWGSGKQTRTFLYVDDIARALLDLVERYSVADPVNLAGSREITIEDLTRLVIRVSGRSASVATDPTRPSGAARRVLDTSKAKARLGFVEGVTLEEGLARTIGFFETEAPETELMPSTSEAARPAKT